MMPGRRPRRRCPASVGGQRVQAGADAVHRVLAADHAGRGDQHVVGSHNRAPRPRRRPPRSALASPSAPVATLAFLEMTTTAWARGRRRAPRLTTTLGPAKRDLVNTPAAVQRPVGDDDHEVVGVVLDADVGDVAAEAERQGSGHGLRL